MASPVDFISGGEVGIHAMQLGERRRNKYSFTYHLCFSSGIQTEDTLFLQCFAKDNQCCDICQRIAGCLGKEGNRSGGTRVYLDNIYVILFIYDELDIEQTDDADTQTKLLCIFQNLPLALLDTEKVGYTEMESPE